MLRSAAVAFRPGLKVPVDAKLTYTVRTNKGVCVCVNQYKLIVESDIIETD